MLYRYTYYIFSAYLLLLGITTNYALEKHNIPIFDEINFALSNHTNNTFNITTKTKYTPLKDIILLIKNHTFETLKSTNSEKVDNEKNQKITLFLSWINKHITNGILYHNGTEIHGWIHQIIYTIETLNMPFLYEWLLTCIVTSPQLYKFNENIITNHVIQKNTPQNHCFIFDEPDFFYPYLFFFAINGPVYDEQEAFILHSNITLLEKNSSDALDFFKHIRDKYKTIVNEKDASNEQSIIFEKTDELIGNVTLLANIIEMIIHENQELKELKKPKINIMYCNKK